jgi:hypothetical protein
LVLGFVTAVNASCRGLVAAGAALFPSYYLVSGSETPLAPPGAREASLAKLPQIYEEEKVRASSCVHIGYPDFAGWASQMVERAHTCRLWELEDGASALVEEHPAADRVLYLGGTDRIAGLLRGAQDRKRAFFLFTMDEAIRREAVGLGLTQQNGFLAALVANPILLTRALGTTDAWTGDSGRTAESKDLGLLRRWLVHGGDRM